MAYEFPIDPAELFAERRPQMLSTGLPAADVEAVRAAVREMWPDAPGGWCYEWSALARRYADAGQSNLSVLAYGWAKFPTLANPAKRTALKLQLEQYLPLASKFPGHFERKVLDIPHQGSRTPVPVHIFAAPGLAEDAPVILASGGVDGWKMDFHDIFAGLAMQGTGRVMVFDVAGTGETEVPLSAEGGGEIVSGLIAEARASGARKVAHLGISLGGYFAARTGLSGEVDAAIDWGGPVEASFAPGRSRQFGMSDIVGNALGYDHRPDPTELAATLAPFSLRPLLDQDRNAPMLIINGADDVHVPQHDTLVFEGRRDTEVHLFPDAGHCAPTKIGEIMPIIDRWLTRTLAAKRTREGINLVRGCSPTTTL